MTATRPTLEVAKAQYKNRFTMEHMPTWAKHQANNGKFYAPQFRTDADWYANTVFPPQNGCKNFCTTSNQTWPLGQWLDAPFKAQP